MLMSKTDTKKLTGNNLCDGNTVVFCLFQSALNNGQ